MTLELIVVGGALDGKVFEVPDGVTLTLGRMPTCEIFIVDDAVSRRHCSLQRSNAEIIVSDLRSANGTFVNNARVTTAQLQPGDQLRVGSTVLECRAGAARPVVPAPAEVADDIDTERTTVIRRVIDPAAPEWLTRLPVPARREEVVERAQQYLATVHRVSDQLSRARSLDGLLESIVSAVLEVTPGERAAVVLRRGDAVEADLKILGAKSKKGVPQHFGVSRTVVLDVLNTGISTQTLDAVADARYASGESIQNGQIRSVMCVPLRTIEAILGALYVDSQNVSAFSEADLELLAAIGNQAGIALHRAQLLTDIERLFLDVMRTIAAAVDAKDGYTHRHSERVAGLGVRIGAALGLSQEQLEVVELSGLLHDVGKIGVPDSILNKPGRLTPEEFAEMKKHPLHGARILANIQNPRVAALLPGVKYHHERWDGSGYPEGLKGEDIPLLGRLLGIADFLDALTSARSYRSALSLDETVVMIQKSAGTHFDPALADVAVWLHAQGELSVPVAPGPALA